MALEKIRKLIARISFAFVLSLPHLQIWRKSAPSHPSVWDIPSSERSWSRIWNFQTENQIIVMNQQKKCASPTIFVNKNWYF